MLSQIKKPFLLGLIKGDLPTQCFQYWLRVDYPYLHNFVKVCALGIVKADTPEDIEIMLNHVTSVQNEMLDHEKHAKALGLTREDLLSFPMGPLKYSYTRHQLSTAYHGSLADTQASILACQWGYGEAVKRLIDQYGLKDNNPYKEWFAFHSDPKHREGFKKALDLLNRHAEISTDSQKTQIENIFMISVKHETMLWDEYYNMSEWETYNT
ncbi:MAG TPA: thiaminase II [Chloroflexi bacterium]|nr:thiaminase II [Chloroflexota bacterium]HCU98809.1 thiaminase II [Chloroflexota bacterium]|tara:strand:+ start:3164 stop:3796 length:633 start_codon:yes stop_codon:yes gene_type:complete